MSDWEPSVEAVEAAFEIIDCRSDDTLNEDIVRRALIAAHAVAEKDGAALVELERDDCAKLALAMEDADNYDIARAIRARGNTP